MTSLVLAAEDAEVALDQLGAHPPPVEQRGGALAVAQHRRRRSRRRVVVVVADGLGLDDVFLVVVVGRRAAPALNSLLPLSQRYTPLKPVALSARSSASPSAAAAAYASAAVIGALTATSDICLW